MSHKSTIAFFGTYLSVVRGSKLSSETIADGLTSTGYRVKMVSRSRLLAARAIQWIWQAWTIRCDVAVLDIFSGRMLHMTNCIARIIAWRGISIVAVLQGGALLDKYERIEPALTPILKRATRIVTPSGFLSEGFNALGYEIEKIPNALRLERFPYRERQPLGRTIRLLWVRAFAEIYRPHWPIEIVWYLRQYGILSWLTMIGPDKGLLAATKARAEELSVTDSIEFVGPVPNDKLCEYFHTHDYLLNTTQFESFGTALAESAATGLPIVSAAVGEIKHSWKDDEEIFLVPGNSSREFADRIAGLCETDRYGVTYRNVNRTARDKVSEFAMVNILPRWERLIESVCREGVG